MTKQITSPAWPNAGDRVIENGTNPDTAPGSETFEQMLARVAAAKDAIRTPCGGWMLGLEYNEVCSTCGQRCYEN
jgi:hypothetical protein